jgi:acyl-CoA thioesterase-1
MEGMRARVVTFVVLALAVIGCGPSAGCNAGSGGTPGALVAEPSSPAPDAPAAEGSIEIAFLGDSLTSGLGLLSEQAYPGLIEGMFRQEGYSEVSVVNGGVSGDTTAGGLRRVEQLLGPNTRILVLALGGNDALRGLTAAQTHDNLAAIIDRGLDHGAAILLTGMHAPTNLGEDYQRAFHNAYVRLSTEYRGSISFIPFLLEGVAGDPSRNQADGIHPNAQGARVIAEQLYPELRRLVDNALNVAR